MSRGLTKCQIVLPLQVNRDFSSEAITPDPVYFLILLHRLVFLLVHMRHSPQNACNTHLRLVSAS